MICNKCGTENVNGSRFCKACGNELTVETVVPVEVPQSTETPQPVDVLPSSATSNMQSVDTESHATASLVLGIISCVFSCSAIIALVCGIIAIVMYRKDLEMGIKTPVGKAGFVCGIIGVIFGALVTLYYIFIVGILACIPLFA